MSPAGVTRKGFFLESQKNPYPFSTQRFPTDSNAGELSRTKGAMPSFSGSKIPGYSGPEGTGPLAAGVHDPSVNLLKGVHFRGVLFVVFLRSRRRDHLRWRCRHRYSNANTRRVSSAQCPPGGRGVSSTYRAGGWLRSLCKPSRGSIGRRGAVLSVVYLL